MWLLRVPQTETSFQFLKMKLGPDKAALLSYSIGQINASPSQIQDEGKYGNKDSLSQWEDCQKV